MEAAESISDKEMWKQKQSQMWGKKDSAGHCWLGIWKGPLVKECRQPLESGKGKETDSSIESLEKNAALKADALILVQQDPFKISELQNYNIL